MRKFLGTGFFIAALVFSGHFAVAATLDGDLTSTIEVEVGIDNAATGNDSEAEVHAGSVISGEVAGDVISNVDLDVVTNGAAGNDSEAIVSVGVVGE